MLSFRGPQIMSSLFRRYSKDSSGPGLKISGKPRDWIALAAEGADPQMYFKTGDDKPQGVRGAGGEWGDHGLPVSKPCAEGELWSDASGSVYSVFCGKSTSRRDPRPGPLSPISGLSCRKWPPVPRGCWVQETNWEELGVQCRVAVELRLRLKKQCVGAAGCAGSQRGAIPSWSSILPWKPRRGNYKVDAVCAVWTEGLEAGTVRGIGGRCGLLD